EVIAATERWLAGLEKNDARYAHDITEALWLHQSHNVVNTSLLDRALTSPDFHARAAAVRVLCYWRDRVSNSLDLLRKAASDDQRREAVVALAKLMGKSELAVVIDAIRTLDAKEKNVNVSVVFDLVRQLTSRSRAELSTARAELENLALTAKQAVLRQIGFVAVMQVDGQVDRAWSLAIQSAGALEDFVSAMPLVSDPGL